MSTPANVLQQLMAPWMTGANPSPLDSAFASYGGTQGLMAALMQAGGPDTTASRAGAALQKARALALDEAGARQRLAQGSIGLDRSLTMLPYYQQIMSGLLGSLGAGSLSSAQPPSSASSNALSPDSDDDSTAGVSPGAQGASGPSSGSAGASAPNAAPPGIPTRASTAVQLPTGAPATGG